MGATSAAPSDLYFSALTINLLTYLLTLQKRDERFEENSIAVVHGPDCVVHIYIFSASRYIAQTAIVKVRI